MPVSIVPCGKDDIEVVRALISHPSLQGEYAMLVHPGVLEDSWGDPYADFELRWLALVDGAPAGYLFTLILPSTTGAWAMIRPAVIARKISCGNRTERGASTWQILVSLATTAQQCGREFLEELTTAIPLMQLVPAG